MARAMKARRNRWRIRSCSFSRRSSSAWIYTDHQKIGIGSASKKRTLMSACVFSSSVILSASSTTCSFWRARNCCAALRDLATLKRKKQNKFGQAGQKRRQGMLSRQGGKLGEIGGGVLVGTVGVATQYLRSCSLNMTVGLRRGSGCATRAARLQCVTRRRLEFH